MRVLIMLPAYNEAAAIGSVVEGCRRVLPGATVLVINDGSVDATSAAARTAGAQVLDLPYNVGIGGAVQCGYLYAWDHGYDVVVRLDADGQHDPFEIPRLLAPIQAGEADYVVGSRFLAPEAARVPLLRRLGIRLLAWLLRVLTGRRFTDPTSGFRAAGRRAIAAFRLNYPTDYPEVETLAAACRQGLRVHEVPVRSLSRQHGSSSITLTRAVYYMLKVPLASLMRATAPRRPASFGG